MASPGKATRKRAAEEQRSPAASTRSKSRIPIHPKPVDKQDAVPEFLRAKPPRPQFKATSLKEVQNKLGRSGRAPGTKTPDASHIRNFFEYVQYILSDPAVSPDQHQLFSALPSLPDQTADIYSCEQWIYNLYKQDPEFLVDCLIYHLTSIRKTKGSNPGAAYPLSTLAAKVSIMHPHAPT